MNKRVRLTQRTATSDTITPKAYPGNVNQPGRTDPAMDAYYTFVPTLNHWIPDMRHEWQDDQRDEIGFGVTESVKEPGKAPIGEGGPLVNVPNPDQIPNRMPTAAAVRVAANKAVKLAVLLLGEKTPEPVIEQQARDFMLLGSEAMDRSLGRFAETQELYTEKETEKDASAKLVEKVEGGKQATDPAPVNPAVEQQKVDGAKAAAPVAEVKVQPAVSEAPAKVDAPKKADNVPVKGPAEMDIELTGETSDEIEPDAEADAKLASLFMADDMPVEEEETEVVEKKTAAAKHGIKKLGGQPKFASESSAATDISNIWASAPDVSEVFR